MIVLDSDIQMVYDNVRSFGIIGTKFLIRTKKTFFNSVSFKSDILYHLIFLPKNGIFIYSYQITKLLNYFNHDDY